MATNNNKANGVTGWVGWVYFAAFMLIAIGFFQTILGFTALLNDQWLVSVGGKLLLLDYTTWGWIHLILGIVSMVVGTGLFNGSTWARVIAVILVLFNFMAQFAFVSVYPVWSIIIMVVDVLVLYALTVHGQEAALEE
jgi:hypothetical protein